MAPHSHTCAATRDPIPDFPIRARVPTRKIAISKVSGVSNAKLVNGPTKVSETEYDGMIGITYKGKTDPFTGRLAKENGTWCWQDASDAQST